VPIHNLGYREWHGELRSSRSRWVIVAEIGIRRAWQSMWLRRMIYLAWVPGVVMGFMIFLFEQSQRDDGAAREILMNVGPLLIRDHDADPTLRAEFLRLFTETGPPGERRHAFWSTLLLSLFRRSQPLILIPMVGVIAPPLISQDFRSRAFLLYFSRPLTKIQYIFGKAATIMMYLFLITLVPALTLFLAGVLLSPGLSVLFATWDLIARIVAISCIIVVPCTFLSLMLSSLTTESRYASFAWFAIWIFGFLTYNIVVPFSSPGESSLIRCVSLFHVFSDVAGWMLDKRLAIAGIETRLAMLATLTAISMAVVYRRVSAPMEI